MDAWPPRIVACVGAVVLRDDAVLLVRQASGQSLAGQWSIPWGVVEADEAPHAAALRETREESGVTATLTGLLGIQTLHQPGWVAFVFLCRHAAGEPKPDGVETDRAAYLSLDALESLREPIEQWCRWLVMRVLRGEYTVIAPEPDNPYRPLEAFL